LRIYILRHGIAEDAPPGGSDADRALTQEGKQKLRSVLECARCAGVSPAVILSSPLRRAIQTAEIAAAVLKVEQALVRTDALAPLGSPERVWSEIRAQDAEELLVAGHEPLLSRVVAFLLGCPALQVRMKKAALVCLEIEMAARERHGTLNWMLTPKLTVPRP
jgi:phosphohistidine phosphatase